MTQKVIMKWEKGKNRKVNKGKAEKRWRLWSRWGWGREQEWVIIWQKRCWEQEMMIKGSGQDMSGMVAVDLIRDSSWGALFGQTTFMFSYPKGKLYLFGNRDDQRTWRLSFSYKAHRLLRVPYAFAISYQPPHHIDGGYKRIKWWYRKNELRNA